MTRPISFRWDKDFIARIDAIRGDVPRSRFVRRAIEDRLKVLEGMRAIEEFPRRVGGVSRAQFAEMTGLAVRSSQQAKAGTGPVPKGGK